VYSWTASDRALMLQEIKIPNCDLIWSRWMPWVPNAIMLFRVHHPIMNVSLRRQRKKRSLYINSMSSKKNIFCQRDWKILLWLIANLKPSCEDKKHNTFLVTAAKALRLINYFTEVKKKKSHFLVSFDAWRVFILDPPSLTLPSIVCCLH